MGPLELLQPPDVKKPLDDFRICTNVSNQTTQLENKPSTSATIIIKYPICSNVLVHFVHLYFRHWACSLSKILKAGRDPNKAYFWKILTDTLQDFYHAVFFSRTTKAQLARVSSTTHWIHSFARCCSVWLPFLSGESWSIKNDKRYKEGQFTVIVWRSSSVHWTKSIRDNLRRLRLLLLWEFSLLFVEYFRGLHGKREVMKISL